MQTPWLECETENYFSYFSTKTYILGTQKNRLDETDLLSTQTILKESSNAYSEQFAMKAKN